MKLTKSDTKMLLLIVIGLAIFFGLLWAGDEYDIPVLKQLHEAVGG